MLDQSLRIYKEQILVPIARQIGQAVHPNSVTLVAFGVGITSGLAASQGMYGWALVLWLGNRTLDGLDGTIARYRHHQSDLGGYIDILLDSMIYAFVVVMLAVSINSIPLYIATAFLLSAYYVNGASWMYLSSILEKRAQGAKAQGEMTSVTMPPGLIEGTETVIFYMLFLLLPDFLLPLYLIFGVLVSVTTAQRLIWAVRQLN